MLASFDDSSVHARRQSKIVGVDNETAHAMSLAAAEGIRRLRSALAGRFGACPLLASQ